MIIYTDTKSNFMDSVLGGEIADIVEKLLVEKLRSGISQSQKSAFQNSFAFMRMMLSETKLDDNTSISIEYTIPNTSKRIDFIISGFGENKENKAIIIELKQWSNVQALPASDGLVKTYIGGNDRIVTHPSYQSWTYQSLLTDFNENIYQIPIDLSSCVFMHNYEKVENDGVFHPVYDDYIKKAPIFTKRDVLRLSHYVDSIIKSPDNHETIKLIETGKIKPSKSLQDSLASMIDGNEEFIMIDEQKVVYEQALALARKCNKDHKKRVMIVEGGPGTGKSVVAINLLANLTIKDELHTRYVTKNSAPRQVYQYYLKKHGRKSKDISYLFTGSGSFTESSTNFYNALIVDEAHRLNEKSGLFANLGENQIKEIINASMFSIFFIDHQQKIHISDIGSSDEIKKWAKYLNAEVFENELVSQFRCNGSDGYLNWIDNVLQIRETANFNFDFDYDFRVFDDVSKMREEIEKLNTNNKSRIVAGYCWDWISKKDPNDFDVRIEKDNFQMKWNLNSEIFAISDSSVSEIGCIHTTQGLEFEYVGVIIGEDMVYRDGKIVTNFEKRASTDKSLFGIKGISKNNPDEAYKIADEIIKNTYRTLMTRGMNGCYVYCVDNKLKKYLIDSCKFKSC